jgi:hypothetical protein
MIDITRTFFLDENDLSKNKLESSISARHVIRSEIQNTKMRNDFYRYLSWRIQTAPLERKIMHRYKNFYVSSFINRSWILIENFIKFAVEVFNNSHSTAQKLRTDSTIEMFEEWWDHDYEEYLWNNMEEEREEKEKHGQTGTEVYLVDNERKVQNQTYDDASAISQKDSIIGR